jgi:hypothetical protein
VKTNGISELEFCEQNLDLLLGYLGRKWNKTNQEVFRFIASWSHPGNMYFPEALLTYFELYPGNKKDFALMMQGKQLL